MFSLGEITGRLRLMGSPRDVTGVLNKEGVLDLTVLRYLNNAFWDIPNPSTYPWSEIEIFALGSRRDRAKYPSEKLAVDVCLHLPESLAELAKKGIVAVRFTPEEQDSLLSRADDIPDSPRIRVSPREIDWLKRRVDECELILSDSLPEKLDELHFKRVHPVDIFRKLAENRGVVIPDPRLNM